jgi:dipeptidyl aminopeptidase/acylaminoacyl peptidase
MMPDGKHFIFLAAKHNAALTSSALWFASLDGGAPRKLMDSPSNAVFASGSLLFVRDSTLLVQRFDPVRGKLLGSPRPTREIVQFDPTTWRAMVTASSNGTLVYGAGGGEGAFRVTLFDRAGNRLRTIGPAANHFSVCLSPDGRRAVVETQLTPNADLWIYDLATGAGTRIAAHPEDESQPVWSPDGSEIAFATRRNGKHYRVDAARADGSGSPRTLVEDPNEDTWVLEWLEGGRTLLLGRGTFQADDNDPLWWHPLDGRPPRLLSPASVGCANAQLSPDGKWLAFDSGVSGRPEVYVIPMSRSDATEGFAATPAGRWQVSASGGRDPRWSHDGRELFYRRRDDTIVTVAVDGRGETFRMLGERPLFQAFQRGGLPTYDVSSDASRFLVNTAGSDQTAPLVVVTNWTELVKGPR